jgi:hypothetical protein
MMHFTVAGTPPAVEAYLEAFTEHAGADELITVHPSPTLTTRLRSVELTAEVHGLLPAATR